MFFTIQGYSFFSPEAPMSQAFLPFSRPSIGDEEIAAVEQVHIQPGAHRQVSGRAP